MTIDNKIDHTAKNINRRDSIYRLTIDRKNLLLCEAEYNEKEIKDYIERVIYDHIIIEKGIYKNKRDILENKDLYRKQAEYLLKTAKSKSNEKINKYSVANYYYYLAQRVNEIANNKNITRNELWKLIKKNHIFKNQTETNIRIYKYIFRGELIPSINFVRKQMNKYNDLPSYLSIIYLDEKINPELSESYNLIK